MGLIKEHTTTRRGGDEKRDYQHPDQEGRRTKSSMKRGEFRGDDSATRKGSTLKRESIRNSIKNRRESTR